MTLPSHTRYWLILGFGLIVGWLGQSPSRAEDWTQWAGNSRECIWNETGILEKFPEGGLKPTWVTKIGSGYSGPVVSNGRVYITDYQPKPGSKKLEAIERLLCLDEATGKIIWKSEWQTHYRRQMQSYATGPRATPLVVNGLVFAIGATGRMHCHDAMTGECRWDYNALEDFGAKVPIFAMSASPLAWKDSVIFVCGGKDGYLRAFDQKTGKPRWTSLPADFDLPYSSPQIMTLAGKTQLIQWDLQNLNSVDPDTGKVNWQVSHRSRANMGLARPVQFGNRILLSAFYDGSGLFEVTATGARKIWKNGGDGERPHQTKSLHSVISTPIVEGDYFYGTCSYGELRGLKLRDGTRVWENKKITRQGRWGSMFWVKNGDRYFVNNDLGELLIMRFTPGGPEVIDRTPLITPDTQCGYGPRRFADAKVNWVQPAYANGHVLIRNDSEIRRVSLLR